MGVSQPLIQTSLLGEAVDCGPALIFVADEDMRFVAVNRRACEVLGYSREELLGLRVPDVVPDPDVAARYAEFVAHRWHEGVATLRKKDGSVLAYRCRASETQVAGLTFYIGIGWPE